MRQELFDGRSRDVASIPAIETRGLAKTYVGGTRALAGVDLVVEQGTIFGLLGQNGAGKTTLIRILLDMIRPTHGSALLMGFDTQRQGVEARRHIGYLPSSPRFYSHMNAGQALRLSAELRGIYADEVYVEGLMKRLDLDPQREIQTLSRGNQQKVGLVLALAAKPDVVILDEPTSGLDPLIQEEVLGIVRDVAAEGRTVFFSSHILHEVEDICDRAAVLRAGELVGVYDLAAERRLAARQVTAVFDREPDSDAFSSLPAEIRVLGRDGRRVTFALTGEVDPLLKALAGHHVTEIEAHRPTLEDFFFGLYRGTELPASREEVKVGV
jgi:beta-exotoxin I transport system ATP-binding protein